MTVADAKRRAARAALEEIPHEGIIGLGSGSTARVFIEELAATLPKRGQIVGVPTSEATRAYAASVGIPLLDDQGPWAIDVNVDGADEVSAELDLIKGGGGAHAREKIVNHASARNVIVVDAGKLSQRLGEKSAVPVEVLPFAHKTTCACLARFGDPRMRWHGSSPMRTDSGNFIYDLATGPIADAHALDRELHDIPGVVEAGLFIHSVDLVIVADDRDVKRLTR